VFVRYPDRIELSNPGKLLVSRVQLLQGGVSECRNKSLQLMFQLMGGGDKAGSGMDKIRTGWRAQHWRSPRLEESLQPDRVKLVLPMVSLIPAEVDQALRLRFGERFAKLDKTAVQAVGELPTGRGLPPIRGGLPSFGGGLPPELPPIAVGLPPIRPIGGVVRRGACPLANGRARSEE
jgi:hypothetical protein